MLVMDCRVKPGNDEREVMRGAAAPVRSALLIVVMMVVIVVVMVVMIAIAVMVIMPMRAVIMMVMAIAIAMMMLRLLLLLFLRLPVMRRRLVMLPQQIESVIVAVRRAHDGVHVEFRRLRVGQEHPGVVVELDEGDRTLHPVIEWAVLTEAADPAEMR